MANEQRVLADFIGGLIDDNPLTNSATTMNSGGLAALPAVGSGQYALITIDPDGTEGAPEEVIVTAHTAAATSATVLRGSSATAHSQNVPWVHGLAARDFPVGVDVPWGGDVLSGGPYDYEFEAAASALPSGWSWFNQGSASYAEQFGAGILTLPAETAWSVHGVHRAVPTPSSWTATGKFTLNGKNASDILMGMVLRDSVGGGLYTLAAHQSAGVDVFGWTNPTTPQGSAKATVAPWPVSSTYYMRIVKNSSTSYDFLVSLDGLFWIPVVTALNPATDSFSPDSIGFGGAMENNMASSIACHWLRVR